VRRPERLAAGVAGIVAVVLGAALVLGGVRQPDVLTAVTHAALGVAVVASGLAILRGEAVGFAAAMSGIAVTLAVAGFVVSGGLGITAGVLALAALFAGGVAYASENYGIFAYALLGDGLAAAAVGAHDLRTDASLLGVTLLVTAVLSLGTAAVVGRAAQ
jgi:hypothetical protein